MQDLQHLMKLQSLYDQEGNIITKRPPNITTKYNSTANLSHDQYPMCLSCKLDTTKAEYTDVVTNKPISGNNEALYRNLYELGDCIFWRNFPFIKIISSSEY